MRVRTPIKPVVVRRKHYWPHITAIALLWGLAMTLEWREAHGAAKRAEQQFIECLRGEWRHTTEEGDEIKCYPVEILKAEDKR